MSLKNQLDTVIINNEIMPYRIAFFEALTRYYNIEVFYCSHRSWERDWQLNAYHLNYPHQFLKGFSLKLRKPLYGEWRTIWINPMLWWHLWRSNPNCIVAYEYSVPSLVAWLVTMIRGHKLIIWSEMTPFTERNLSRGQRLTRWILRNRLHAAIGTSYAACDTFREAGVKEEKIILATQTIDPIFFEPPPSQKDPFSILYIGHLNERKGVNHLLYAFQLILQTIPQATLKLVGNGEHANALAELTTTLQINHAVTFDGFVEPVETQILYATASIFVLPSLEDTFGVVAMEALASNVCLVCSQYAGASSHLTDGVDSFIVDPYDHRMMAKQTIKLIENADLRQEFNKNGQKVVMDCHPEVAAEHFANGIRRALDSD